ncbi:uncharacterized protein EI90DRAFT_2100105 [Cantharellus anzutake]|uniref:uncharacterized protein n=1 Tax=Cantharellus anzutake TaxID=1750568 RepID=UPI001907BFE9|nr:uncharacterized protein EI90DRAFT_2100105 [Cantharellus anzutake]KAF8340694.1 hypothetical protein EI90DRAFT_2100105 [Cantharellus anzutake]
MSCRVLHGLIFSDVAPVNVVNICTAPTHRSIHMLPKSASYYSPRSQEVLCRFSLCLVLQRGQPSWLSSYERPVGYDTSLLYRPYLAYFSTSAESPSSIFCLNPKSASSSPLYSVRSVGWMDDRCHHFILGCMRAFRHMTECTMFQSGLDPLYRLSHCHRSERQPPVSHQQSSTRFPIKPSVSQQPSTPDCRAADIPRIVKNYYPGQARAVRDRKSSTYGRGKAHMLF